MTQHEINIRNLPNGERLFEPDPDMKETTEQMLQRMLSESNKDIGKLQFWLDEQAKENLKLKEEIKRLKNALYNRSGL